MSGFLYYFIMFIMSVSISLTFLIDRIYSQKFKGIISTLVFPSAYVLMDFIVISNNPSGSFGTLVHSQTSLPLLQILSITGLWGLIFIITWTSSIINWVWDNGFDKSSLRKTLWVFVLPLIIIFLFGQVRLAMGIPEGTVKIASVKVTKMEVKNLITEQINSRFLEDCHIASMSKAKIIFGTEAMLNMTSDKEGDYLEKAKAVAKKDKIYIGLPLLIYTKDKPNVRPMNKITWISPKGDILFTYFKAKPTTGEGHYGDEIIKYFDSPFGRIGSAICFDMDFPALISQVSNMNIDIMLVPGNDWQEISPYHTYVASARAIEQGFNLVRAATRGLSASFNYKGQVLSYQDYFKTNDLILYSDVPTKGQKTIYAILGNYFAWLCILFLIAISIMYIKSKWTKKEKQI